MWFSVVTLFPEMFQALESGMTGRAKKDKLLELSFFNPRDFTQDKHRTVDDRPYGGGPGMVMLANPLQEAIQAAKRAAKTKPTVIYLSPQGQLFTQKNAPEFLEKKSIIFIAGRYEGIDERIIETEVDEEWSIGDYIITGGELAAMVIIDATTRLIPGVLGDADSVLEDSITSGLLKYPQYTRPENFQGNNVPKVLLSGNHQAISQWRLKHSLGKTWLKRPALLAEKPLTEEELKLLATYIEEFIES